MKVLICGDVHYNQYTSIVRKRGDYYSSRLENLLWSINWVERTAHEQNAEKIIYLGDFFDRADLNAEEITAFRDIQWAKDIDHYFLIGNHETASHTLEYSSSHLLSSLELKFHVIDKPYYESGFGYRFIYLPYIFEKDRKPIKEYEKELLEGMIETQELKRTYIFSHNDIEGIQYGLFESKDGFEKQDILNNCDLFINGHIHNRGWVADSRILNVGNLTGQNFNEDALKYKHGVDILNTDTQSMEFIENPYALNFIKLDLIDSKSNIPELNHLVLSVKCNKNSIDEIRNKLDSCKNIDCYKLIVASDNDEENQEEVELIDNIDHLQQFQSYIINQLGKSNIVLKELQEVIR